MTPQAWTAAELNAMADEIYGVSMEDNERHRDKVEAMLRYAAGLVQAVATKDAQVTEALAIVSYCVDAARDELDPNECGFALSFPAVLLVSDVVTAYKQELTAAAERESALREEKYHLEKDRDAARADRNRFQKELAAERQKVAALREWHDKRQQQIEAADSRTIEGGYRAGMIGFSAELRHKMDALGLTAPPAPQEQSYEPVTCMALSEGEGWHCSMLRGHDGPHRAFTGYDLKSTLLIEWFDAPAPQEAKD